MLDALSGGADKVVKFWKFALKEVEGGQKQPVLVHTRTLTMTDEVLSITMTADCKLVCVALLDSTVKASPPTSQLFLFWTYVCARTSEPASRRSFSRTRSSFSSPCTAISSLCWRWMQAPSAPLEHCDVPKARLTAPPVCLYSG